MTETSLKRYGLFTKEEWITAALSLLVGAPAGLLWFFNAQYSDSPEVWKHVFLSVVVGIIVAGICILAISLIGALVVLSRRSTGRRLTQSKLEL